MPATDLTTVDSIRQNLFVELVIPSYATLRFSDYDKAYTIDGDSYDSLGSLMGVTKSKTELRASNQQLTISISGLPSANLSAVMDANLKGSTVTVRRAFFDPVTGAILTLSSGSNPAIRFEGMVTNFGIDEQFGQGGSFVLSLQCSSILKLLLNRTSGRRTNPQDQEKFFGNDTAMSRVPEIRNSNYNFGAPDIMPKVGTK